MKTLRNIFLTISIVLLSTSSNAEMYNKPVYCGSPKSLHDVWEEDGLIPLVGLGGVSWDPNGETHASVIIVVANAETGRHAVIENTANGYCLLETGSTIEFDPATIKGIMEWE